MISNTHSDDFFHDIIKSLLHRRYQEIFEICKTIPITKNSTLIKGSKSWAFQKPDQEVLTSSKFRNYAKMDDIWYFGYSDERIKYFVENSSYEIQNILSRKYLIIHEIKSGFYTLEDVYGKYYSGMDTQIWIWAWEKYHKMALSMAKPEPLKKVKHGAIKQINIEYIIPMCIDELERTLNKLKAVE
jgi:hypothetical protein